MTLLCIYDNKHYVNMYTYTYVCIYIHIYIYIYILNERTIMEVLSQHAMKLDVLKRSVVERVEDKLILYMM